MYGFYLFNVSFIHTTPPPHIGCAGGRIGTRFLRPSPLKGGTPEYRNGTESFFGLKGRTSDET